jgi:glycosyltransferase involved in cell wall biosynthesis
VSAPVDSLTILHVAQSSEYGLGRYLTELLASQVARGWRVVMAGNPSSELVAPATEAGASYVPWVASRQPGLSSLREARALRTIIRDVAPDVVHLHSSKAGLCGRAVLRRRLPTLFQPHGWSFHVGGATQAPARQWERAAARWADVIVCVSAQEREEGVAAGVRGDVRVVPSAVDLSRFPVGSDVELQRQARSRIGLDARPTAICVGRLSYAKGQDRLLAAWPLVEAIVPNARLVLVGDGEDREALERQAVGDVMFVGRSDAVVDWLVAADVIVQPSRWEGMSIAVLEAMAAGRAIVATDVVGMGEVIGRPGDPDAAGVLVPPDDPAAMANALAARLQDPGLRLREGRSGRERAVRSHDLRSWGEQMANLVGEVRGRRRS